MEGIDFQISIVFGFGYYCCVGGLVDYLLFLFVVLFIYVIVFIQIWCGFYKGYIVFFKLGVIIWDSDGEILRFGNRDQINCCLDI